MGVNLVGIIGHSHSTNQVLDLPNQINEWSDVNDLIDPSPSKKYKKAKWDGNINKDQLELIWKYYESSQDDLELNNKLEIVDSVIHCWFGTMAVYRKTVLITHWKHDYDHLRNPKTAKYILTLNRVLAKYFEQNEILYCTDSGYPTESIQNKAVSGSSFRELKKYGLIQFGNPPAEINQARKYMFFIDCLDRDLGDITEWEKDDSPYWYYDAGTRNYKQKKK